MGVNAAQRFHFGVEFRCRPATALDEPFLQALYASTREAELARSGWSDAQVAEFLQMQFRLQHRYYREQYPDASFDLILDAGQHAIGRRYVLRRPAVIKLIDLALLPAWRGKGLGSAMLQALLDEAALAACPVLLYVEQDNPARRLYERLGFVETGNGGVHLQLRWSRPAMAESVG